MIKVCTFIQNFFLPVSTLQSAIGETDAKVGQFEDIPSGGGGNTLDADAVVGIREDVARQMAGLEERLTELKTDVNRQEEATSNRLKMVIKFQLFLSSLK